MTIRDEETVHQEIDLSGIEDVARGYVVGGAVTEGIRNGSIVLLSGRTRNVIVGRRVPVKVNTNIGISTTTPVTTERSKLARLSSLAYRPDLIMDHTVDHSNRQFWKEMVETFDGPVGTLPHYTAYTTAHGIDPSELVDRIEEMLVGGVAFMTLHFTADADIYEIAKRSRSVPVTSRGGGLAIRDVGINGRRENVFRSRFAEVVCLFRKHDAAISVGTTFRPANIASALDEAHLLETGRQIAIVNELKRAGVKVLMEGVGHVSIDKIGAYANLIAEANCPFMPLGPMTTDSAIGFDHVTSAIGGAFMAWAGGAHILNSVTREEHTGGVPTEESILDGLKAARVAAHSVNVARFSQTAFLDELTVKKRASQTSCVVSGGLFGEEVNGDKKGCNRCSFECPLILAPSTQESGGV